MIRSRTRSSSGPVSAESSSARASPSAKPSTGNSGSPAHVGLLQLPRREDQTDRFRRQAARDEPENLRGGTVEPLLVIHKADQRPFLSHLRQEAQHGQTNQESVRRRSGTDAEHGLQRITLRYLAAAQRGPAPAQHNCCNPANASSISG